MQWTNSAGATSDFCSALTAVFPLILITVLINGREIRETFRRGKLYVRTVGIGVTTSFAGLIVALIGVQTEGLPMGPSLLLWALTFVSLAALFIVVLLLSSTFDKKDKNTPSALGDGVNNIAER